MTLLIEGKNRKQVASEMNLKIKTVNDHVDQVRKRLKAKTVYQAIAIVAEGNRANKTTT